MSKTTNELRTELRLEKALKKYFQSKFDEKRKELEGCLSEVKELTIFNEGMLNSSFAIRLERVQGKMTRLIKKLLIQSRKVDNLEIDLVNKKEVKNEI